LKRPYGAIVGPGSSKIQKCGTYYESPSGNDQARRNEELTVARLIFLIVTKLVIIV
jgi:hypothetical protein